MKFKDILHELNEKVEIDQSKYIASHGKPARGNGNWYIEVEGKEYNVVGKLTNAVAQAVKKAKEDGIAEKVYKVTVLP